MAPADTRNSDDVTMHRRTFLKLFAGASVVAAGAPVTAGCASYPAAEGLAFFSPKEFAIGVSMAEAILPDPTAAETLMRQMDAMVVANSDAIQDATSQGLLLLEHGSTILDLTFSRFTKLDLDERRAIVQKWFVDGFTDQRLLVFNFRRAMFFLYYAQPEGYKETGYDGPFVKEKDVYRP